MSNPMLDIYYDNPNEASDMYLKWLKKDCEKNGIEIRMFDNEADWASEYSGDGELFLEPTKNLPSWYKDSNNNVDYPSATATGIYNWIVENCPSRSNIIAVIGRGLVGKQLIDKLIDYGYTVVEFNSKSYKSDMEYLCCDYANVVVGLATEQVFDKDSCKWMEEFNTILIDSGNNFETKNKLTCGKWTRQVIIDRVLENYKKGQEDG
jgi:5,10-methylene-tetrahydrofolate dehydrogenase/methenyl tetrahydrofolate cyclohydrolase